MADPVPSRPRVGLAVAVVPHRLASLDALLADVVAQSEPAAAVHIVFQGGTAADAEDLAGVLAGRFPSVNIIVTANGGKGLSEARNLILDRCEEDILLLADDDAGLDQNTVRNIGEAFRMHPTAAVIAFKAEWTGGPRRTNYPQASGRLRTKAAVAHVVSIEIAMQVARIRRLGVRFDERFGPGARLATGEEFIFLTDVLGRGGEIEFVPIELASHAAESSGRRRLDAVVLTAKGAMFARTYGTLGALAAVAFVLRKALQGELDVGPVSGIMSALEGWRELRR